MNNVLLGRYIKSNSVLHQLDPRTKLMITFAFIIVIFIANNWLAYGVLAAFVLLAIFLSDVPFITFLKGVQPMIILILFTVALQLFFTRGGTVYWEWGIFALSSLGIQSAAFIFVRFVLIIFMSTLLTLTTAPLELADAIESLLGFAKGVIPVHEIALMLSIALRFVPTLLDETNKIMNAQRSRGVDFGDGSMVQQAKAIIPILIPLFVSAFNRAFDLATAMEARGYKGSEGRTKYRKLEWGMDDNVALAVFVVMVLVLFYVKY